MMAPQAGSERETYPPFKTPLFAKIMARSTGDNNSSSRDNAIAVRVVPMNSLLGLKRPLSALYKHEYGHSSEDDGRDIGTTTAGSRQRDTMEDRFLQLPTYPPQPERKVQLPPAHEVRFLRDESQRLETELQRICKKWRAALPDPRARYAACEAAKQKTITAQVESINTQLKTQLLQQQLYYALLQRTLSGAPLWQMGCVCDEMLERMHGFLHLGPRVEDRIEQLQSRFDLAIRMAPPVVGSFTKDIPMDQASSQLVPFSRTSARGNETHTLISNIFACKIPVHSSAADSGLQRVFEAAVASQKDMQSEMAKRLGIHTDTEIIHELGGQRSYVKVTRRDGELRGLTSNVAFAAELVRDDLAVIVTDFTDEDELVRNDSEFQIDSCNISTFTRHYDEAQDQHYVLLRRLHVFRYNLLSNSALLFREINRAMPFINGDLPLALLCEAMRARTTSGSSGSTTAA